MYSNFIPALWLRQKCPVCGHRAEMIFKPDILKGPKKFHCQSVNNPCAKPCYHSWSIAVDDIGKKDIVQNIVDYNNLQTLNRQCEVLKNKLNKIGEL